MSILLTALPALIPVFADGLRGLFARITGGAGAKPQTIAEVAQLASIDIERLKALALLDTPGGVHAWVADIRALQRPAAVLLVLVAYLYTLYAGSHLPAATLDSVAQYAQMVTFYLFGDRSYAYLKGKNS